MQTQIFPPKEVAMELKNVGFDWGCVGWYNSDHEDNSTEPIIEGDLSKNSEFVSSCTAPTYDQVIGWFAEVHGIHISSITDNGTEYGWFILQKGQTIDSDFISCDNDFTPNRQQSLLTAFREAIKLIQP